MIPTSKEERFVNVATAFSIVLTLVLTIVAVIADVKWSTALVMVLSGLALYAITNIMGLFVLKSSLARRTWLVLLTANMWPFVLLAVSLYMAGLFTLVIQLVRGWIGL